MQLRCSYCQTMFAISRDETLAALEHLEEHKLSFYDAHCPKCRRANRVERAKLERTFPDWQKTIQTMANEAVKAEAAEKSAPPAEAMKPAKKSTGEGKKK